MLRQRVLTALVLVPLVVAADLLLSDPGVALLVGAVMLLGAWEWAALAGLPGTPARAGYVLLLGGVLVAGWLLRDTLGAPVVWGAVAAWCGAAAWVLTFQLSGGTRPGAPGVALLRLLGPLVLAPAWLALVLLHALPERGPWLMLYLLVLVWVADTAAYFSGRRWGRRKLARHVSPGKSWEGVAGGLLCSLLLALGAGLGFGYQGAALAAFALLGVVTVAVSVLGDLFESLLKRYRQVKDSGGLLPGHGGVLDRIDSLTAAGPLFLAGLWLLGAAR
ncbi:MAG TPA: phosphatidate cytidylyltransferase [Gammaproteobacteria bacterium]